VPHHRLRAQAPLEPVAKRIVYGGVGPQVEEGETAASGRVALCIFGLPAVAADQQAEKEKQRENASQADRNGGLRKDRTSRISVLVRV
jgi:hypothetical protein